MTESEAGGVYGSGLNEEDWDSLRDVLWPFIHAEEPGTVQIPHAPDHLKDHNLVQFIREYRETGDEAFLDKAGQILIPTSEPFGWYVPLTK